MHGWLVREPGCRCREQRYSVTRVARRCRRRIARRTSLHRDRSPDPWLILAEAKCVLELNPGLKKEVARRGLHRHLEIDLHYTTEQGGGAARIVGLERAAREHQRGHTG